MRLLPGNALAIALLWALPALAHEEAEGTTAALVDVRDRLIHVVPAGLGGIALAQKGQPLPLGFAGSHVDAIFHEFPDALAAARTYRGQSIAGHVLAAVGAAALVTDIVLLVAWGTQPGADVRLNDHRGLFYGLLVGGAVTGIAGSYLIAAAQGHLLEAVNRHNVGVLNGHLPPERRIGVSLFLDSRQQGAALSYRF